MTIFGDDEPEDAWHPDDPVHELVDNILRRARLLRGRRMLSDHDLHRVELIVEDLAFVLGRLQ